MHQVAMMIFLPRTLAPFVLHQLSPCLGSQGRAPGRVRKKCCQRPACQRLCFGLWWAKKNCLQRQAQASLCLGRFACWWTESAARREALVTTAYPCDASPNAWAKSAQEPTNMRACTHASSHARARARANNWRFMQVGEHTRLFQAAPIPRLSQAAPIPRLSQASRPDPPSRAAPFDESNKYAPAPITTWLVPTLSSTFSRMTASSHLPVARPKNDRITPERVNNNISNHWNGCGPLSPIRSCHCRKSAC